ncbi:SMI1/KNR4 family protein [Pseudomonas sp. EL_65y_Pfl2_R95]|uniref:SMI1/KNR4 family protein n=1 Tax=Pseudomonas sp. EL_65y_Pfl2_R95 TaxID=3088698 RepID=UPI0030DD5113
MEEVIDQLRELNEPVPVPLELPEEEVLVEIQEQILIHLPFELREFLLKVSDVVYGRLEPVTATDPQSHTYLPEVASVAWSLGVPRELVPICEDRGNYYCVEEDGTVVLWEQDTEELSEENWESVWHWVRDVWLES